jgi:hypothetical protein
VNAFLPGFAVSVVLDVEMLQLNERFGVLMRMVRLVIDLGPVDTLALKLSGAKI